jgi:hypothetical protein
VQWAGAVSEPDSESQMITASAASVVAVVFITLTNYA